MSLDEKIFYEKKNHLNEIIKNLELNHKWIKYYYKNLKNKIRKIKKKNIIFLRFDSQEINKFLYYLFIV
jgi:hypothetical protein